MSEPKKISDKLAAAGQPTAADLQQAAAAGFKSVVNLRPPEEAGTLADEQQQAEAAGLQYVNVPLSPVEAGEGQTDQVLAAIEGLPTPILFHCGVGGRASALALITLATQQDLNHEQALAKARELGLNLEQPHLKQFLDQLSAAQGA